MSMPTKEVTQGVVTSIQDDALVMVANGSQWSPISFSNLMKAVRSRIDLSKSTAITVDSAEWLRVAKANTSSFSAILSVSHGWTSGRPTPLLVFINGSASNADGFNACQITEGSYYDVNPNPPASSNPGLSFTALRFVKEGNDIFVEVKFKPNAKTTSLHTSLAGQIGAIALVDATVSTADAANILKTIDFSGGV